MLGIWRRKKPLVLRHWYVLVLDFDTSTQEFYDAIEKDLEERKLTGLEISRINYAEGGLLFSARREYLRMRRERLVFDVCSAPFGTTWFFSCRFSEIRLSLMVWEVILVLMIVAGIVQFYANVFGWLAGSILFAASLLSLLFIMRNTVKLGLQDIDAALLQIPIVGAFYEIFLRRESYYREDTRLAYMDIVDKIVRARIEEVTGAKGIKLLEYKHVIPPWHATLLGIFNSLLRIGW
jgi:hypothetical protein